MQKRVYLAFYKGKGNFIDKLIRFFTKGEYSHCELVVKTIETDHYVFYSSSPRDGGVRRAEFTPKRENWHFLNVSKKITPAQLERFYQQNAGKKYDLLGALGVVLGLRQDKKKLFCSEFCFNALHHRKKDGWRFSPQDLWAMYR